MKKTFYLLLTLLIFSCSENENNNGVSSDFEVVVSSFSSTKAEINWSRSFDPEEETVLYSVYLEGNRLVKNTDLRSYSFKNLVESKNYKGRVVASDENGNKKDAPFLFTTRENLPPEEFEVISITKGNISLDISWTKAIDPEEGNIVYELFINNELITNSHLSENYLFQGLKVDTNYEIKINAKDEAGNISTLISNTETLDGVYNRDIDFSTQDSLIEFGEKGYIEINGDLEIEGSSIYDLSPIGDIKKVRGHFTIRSTRSLATLAGLKVEHIGKSLTVFNNDSLTNLEGLANLVDVFGGVSIDQNSNLKDISNINKLIKIGNDLSIDNNINLLSITGFDNLESANTISIKSNWLLNKVNCFRNLKKLTGSFIINENNLIDNISSLDKLETIEGGLIISNTLIEQLNIFPSLTLINYSLNISANENLENIEGLTSLKIIKYSSLKIIGNLKLKSLKGLDNLEEIGYTISISGNAVLSNFCALQNVMQTFVPASIPDIAGNLFNPSLSDIANGNCEN